MSDDSELIAVAKGKQEELDYCYEVIDELKNRQEEIKDYASKVIREMREIVYNIAEDYLEHTEFESKEELAAHYIDKGDE